jgi:hypothetical protein
LSSISAYISSGFRLKGLCRELLVLGKRVLMRGLKIENWATSMHNVTFLKLTELAIDGEHIPWLPVNEPEVPESHVLQQKDNCPPHVLVECLLVGSVSLLIIEREKKVDHPIYVEKEHNFNDDDGQQGLQGLRTWGVVRKVEAYIGSGLLPDFTSLLLGSDNKGCADDSSD